MKAIARLFFNELFYVLTAAAITFVILEIIWPEMVLAYFNLNYLLIFWLITGIIAL